MTPEQFEERMKWIMHRYPDAESRHRAADNLLEDALSQLGFRKGLDIYREIEKGYRKED